MISILSKLFDHLKAQAPTVEACDALTLQLNTSFQKVFEIFLDLRASSMLAPISSPSVARGGEGPSSRTQPRKPASEFLLRDGSSDDNVQVLTGSYYAVDGDSSDEDMFLKNGVLGLQASREFPTKVMTEEEQRIWSAVY